MSKLRYRIRAEVDEALSTGSERSGYLAESLKALGADSATTAKAIAMWAGSGIAEQSLRAVQAAKPHARWAAQKVFNELTNTDFFNLDDGTVNNWREWIRDPDAPAAKKGGRR